jgi:PNKP adenylyltransferase domain, C-terminal region
VKPMTLAPPVAARMDSTDHQVGALAGSSTARSTSRHSTSNGWAPAPARIRPRLGAFHRFVEREPLRRVRECIFGELALESEPVDPHCDEL